jgi:predicted dithiol-disulfide oxidoreductase (DUF899 family)
MPPPPSPKERYPSGASQEYITARNALLEAELALRNQVEAVAAQRRALPPGALLKDYTLIDSSGTPVKLAELAADGRTLVVYHMMFGPDSTDPCVLCASFIDGFNGVGQHLARKFNFVVVAKSPIDKLSDYAARRGWKDIRFLSSHQSDFNGDMGFEDPAGSANAVQMEGISVYKMDSAAGNLRHVYSASARFDTHTFRGMDLLSPLWNLLDLVPEGRGDTWYPGNSYMDMNRK